MSRVSVPTVTVVHYLDPLCPWSLGLEAPVARLKDAYRDRLRVEYRTAVAVPEIRGWMKQNGFDYDSVAKFHVQLAKRTGAGFEPDFLRKTGIKSSLPACLAFKAAQMQDEEAAAKYLRDLMDAFLVRAEHFDEDALIKSSHRVGLDEARVRRDMSSKSVEEAVKEDTKAMQNEGASFLDLIVMTPDGHSEKVSEAFDSESVMKVIDRLVPGLPKYPSATKVG